MNALTLAIVGTMLTDGAIYMGPSEGAYIRNGTRDDSQHITITNEGEHDTIIAAVPIGCQYVSSSPSVQSGEWWGVPWLVGNPIDFPPGKTVRFDLSFWPPAYASRWVKQGITNFGKYPDRTYFLIAFRHREDLLVPLRGHSTFQSDLNLDGIVNLADLGLLQQAKVNYNPTYDIVIDGVIDQKDLTVMSREYMKPRDETDWLDYHDAELNP